MWSHKPALADALHELLDTLVELSGLSISTYGSGPRLAYLQGRCPG